MSLGSRAPLTTAAEPAPESDAGALIHEFNNVLARLVGASEQLVQNLGSDPANRELAGLCLDNAERAAALLAGLRAAFEPRAVGAEPIDCREMLDRTLGFVRAAARRDVELQAIATPGLACVCDREGLEGALLLLLLNALSGAPAGVAIHIEATRGHLTPAAARALRLPAGFVEITVRGGGAGRMDLVAIGAFAQRSGGGFTQEAGPAPTSTLYLPAAG